jgi:hypothetical protein
MKARGVEEEEEEVRGQRPSVGGQRSTVEAVVTVV